MKRLLVCLLCVGCGGRGAIVTPKETPNIFTLPTKPVCEQDYADPVAVANLGEPALLEVSGMVASPTHKGVLWMHNDSGDDARIFAISTEGAPLGTLKFPDVEARDFEDIAAAPCPDLSGPCIYVADTGDNNLEREFLVVYAVREPTEVSPEKPLPEDAASDYVWRFPVVPAPQANIEAFIVLPDATAMIFFEKSEEDARSFIYPAPWTPNESFTLQEVARFDPPGVDVPFGHFITGADIHPTAKRLLIRTYSGVFEAKLEGASAADVDAITFDEVFVGAIDEPQGEAVAYDEEGTGIWTVSESPSKDPGQPLHHVACNE
jgi:hypothetical protein